MRETSLAQATRNFDDAVTDYRSAAARAAHMIGSAISHDGLKDPWWDRNFGWIKRTVFKIIAIVVVVLAVVALLLAMPWSAALLASMLGFFGAEVSVATLGTIAAGIGWTLFGVTAVQAAYDGTAAATGKESRTAFALAAAGMGADPARRAETARMTAVVTAKVAEVPEPQRGQLRQRLLGVLKDTLGRARCLLYDAP